MPVQVSLNDFSTDSEASNHLQPLTSILLVVLVKPRGAGLKIPALRCDKSKQFPSHNVAEIKENQ